MNILTKLSKYYLYMIIVFFIGRLSLFIIYFDKLQNSDTNYWLTFIYGLRMDTIVASTLLIIPMFLLTLSPTIIKNFTNLFLKYYFLIVLSFLIYMEVATFPFIAQYDVRPNYLFVEYLVYPKEVFSMIFAEYKFALSVAFMLIVSFIYYYLKYIKDSFTEIFNTSYLKRIALFIPLLLLLFIGIRSSFGHRGANISDAMYSSNRTVNEITKNSIHSVLYAVYVNAKYEGNRVVKQYGRMDIKEAISRVEKRLNIKSLDDKFPLLRVEKTHFKTQNSKNLVIFLQESLGYQFVQAVGGEKGITPNLNKLSKESILFKDLYSNGTRSIRGIAGIVSGNFSVPGKGVVKRNKSQRDYFTIAKLLKPYGYHTSFIYGGESRFDNMRGWFLGNGFDKIIDQPKFVNPSFVGTWGVCDEDVINRANEEYKNMYAKNQKFASVIFSTSNHSPFDFPDNKIDLIKNEKKKSVKNAIKYADFAIGKFIEQAKKENYYKDTIFVIVADHNVRVYGDDMVPIDMFQVPAIILGKDIKPFIYNKLATQPDVLSTALDLLGLDLKYPIMGHSIFSDKKQNIALMQFNTSYALRVDNKVAVLRPNKKAITFEYKNKHLRKLKHDEELEKDLLAFVITLNHLYNHKLYK
ncbi:Phosphoglycerol transferase I [hydrothermal vent metagenome]|uniref:Phosphoglycerol transferase I n=1 Tax=hydrothermal vent metagenome TaxID=652676 RepID=A0A3B1E621_9ZZZZ